MKERVRGKGDGQGDKAADWKPYTEPPAEVHSGVSR